MMIKITAKEMMTPNVLAAKSYWSIERLAEFFIENSISGAPVQSEDGNLIGVVSMTDIIHHKTQYEKDTQWPHDYYLQALQRQYAKEDITSLHIEEESSTTVYSIMTPMIFKVSENTPIQQVAAMMIENLIHRVFVTQKDNVIGIISTPDMLKVILEL
jgi:predicted transcriptional regulator